MLFYSRPFLISLACSLALFTAGCGDEDSPETEPSGNQSSLPGWAPEPDTPVCALDNGASWLEEILAEAGLSASFGWSNADWNESDYERGGYLNDRFTFPWFKPLRAQPLRLGCFTHELSSAVDTLADGEQPVANLIRHAAKKADLWPESVQPLIPSRYASTTWQDPIVLICESYGAACSAETITGTMPSGLGEALKPVLWAIYEGVAARRVMESESGINGASWWHRYGGHFTTVHIGEETPDGKDEGTLKYLAGGEGRRGLNGAAARIAHAVESLDLSEFARELEAPFVWDTPAGAIRIYGSADDIHPAEAGAILLEIDLGGNDTYLGASGANFDGDNPVSVSIDVSGTDRYQYPQFDENVDWESNLPLLPADEGGRYGGDDYYGVLSLSRTSRQGAARNGIAFLFDFGQSDDRYVSLHSSQGYAHQGVGVLFDGGGNDTYLSETLSQGAAQFGIGILVDIGDGNDTRLSFNKSQGFGYSAGIGYLIDQGGNDLYTCDHGDPDQGGTRLYYTPQLPQNGNSSLCQGVGFGRRSDKDGVFFSGGLGLLRDRVGDDQYDAGVFAQGAGYWQSTGILSDGAGTDRYEAAWYVMGGAAHYAIGVLADGGEGDDTFAVERGTRNVSLGSGHDFSVGLFINERGDDTYQIGTLGAGASNCSGIGIFVDNAGDDSYTATSDYSSGMGNVSGECIEMRPNAMNVGLMLDAGGFDIYNYPEDSEFSLPENNSTWGHARNGLDSEIGVGRDGEGESGIHCE